jgi:hypothetical protein
MSIRRKEMSIDFWTKPRLRMEELFDGRLENWGIFEPTKDKKVLPDTRCLADGKNYVWVYSCEDGMISGISSYGLYDPYDILKAISEAFEVDMWLELDLQAGHHKLVIKRPTVQRAAASSRAGNGAVYYE